MHQDTKKLFKHLWHLLFLKGLSRLIPLITIPWLVRTIGLEKLGVIKWVEAIADYLLVFMGYGFRYTATQQIASYQPDKQLVGQLLGAVYTIKAVAIILAGGMLLLLMHIMPQLQALSAYLLTYYAVIVISMLFPCFVFQGLDQMHWMTWINLLAKLVFLASIMLWVRTPADALLYHLCLALSYLLRLGIAFVWLYYGWHIRIGKPTWSMIVQQLQQGLPIFLAQLATNSYGRLPAIFLGFFVGPLSVATHVLGTKVVYTLTSMIDPFNQALYPIASKKLSANIQSGIRFVGRVAWIGLAVLAILGMVSWYFADAIVQLLANQAMPEAVQVLKLYAWLPCMVLITHLMGVAILLPLNAGYQYTLTMLLAGMFCMVLHFLLVPLLQIPGAVWSVWLTETLATALLLFFAYKRIKFFMQQEVVAYPQKCKFAE